MTVATIEPLATSSTPTLAPQWLASVTGLTTPEVLALAHQAALLHRAGPDGWCLGCFDLARLAGPLCPDGEWGRAALYVLATPVPEQEAR